MKIELTLNFTLCKCVPISYKISYNWQRMNWNRKKKTKINAKQQHLIKIYRMLTAQYITLRTTAIQKQMPTHTYMCAAFTLYTRFVCWYTQCHAMTVPVVCMCMSAYYDRKHNIQQAKQQNSTNINRSSSGSSRNGTCASFVCVLHILLLFHIFGVRFNLELVKFSSQAE